MDYVRQTLILLWVSVLGTAAASVMPFPFPATVASMLLLFVLLLLGWIKLPWVEDAGGVLTKYMAWLLVPLGANLAQSMPLWLPHWWKLLLVSVVAVVPTFLVTQLTVRGVVMLQRRIGKGDEPWKS